ncbi:MAG: hypothetical protein ACRDXD_10165 [Acidimicrobiia bacterium]
MTPSVPSPDRRAHSLGGDRQSVVIGWALLENAVHRAREDLDRAA